MIRAFSRRHPRSIATIVIVCFATVLLLPYLVKGPIDMTNGTGILTFDAMTAGIIWQAVLTVCLIIIIAVLGWFDVTSIRGPLDRAGLKSFYWLAAFPVLGVSFIWGDGQIDPALVFFIVLTLNLLVGLSEEFLFRGILFGALRQRHRIITAIAISSCVFGIAHLPNLGLGQSLQLTLYQVVNAIILGALFCAITLQANSIWPAVFLHMMWNTYIMLNQFVIELDSHQTPGQSVDYPVLTFSSILPLLILLWITVIVLRTYTKRTGQSLRRVVPTYTILDNVSA